MSHLLLATDSCISLYGMSQLVFESETHCVVCEVQIEYACKIYNDCIFEALRIILNYANLK